MKKKNLFLLIALAFVADAYAVNDLRITTEEYSVNTNELPYDQLMISATPGISITAASAVYFPDHIWISGDTRYLTVGSPGATITMEIPPQELPKGGSTVTIINGYRNYYLNCVVGEHSDKVISIPPKLGLKISILPLSSINRSIRLFEGKLVFQ